MSKSPDDQTLLTPQQVSSALHIPLRTLDRWRLVKKGPRALRIGRHVRYLEADLWAWVHDQELERVKRHADTDGTVTKSRASPPG